MHWLSLLLVPALTPHAVHSLPRARLPAGPLAIPRSPESPPYLAVTGAPPLRFQRPIPPPDLVTRPVAGAPPIPQLSPTEVAVAQNNVVAAAPVVEPPRPPLSPPPAESKPPAAAPPERSTVRPIIPDDTRAPVRTEDFLPYFRLPGAKAPGEPGVIVPAQISAPAPAAIPPSSATYTQSPR
ncbi:MAG: hypothetical protein FJ399_21640 [Verrucomicrobia bacterium]|nr:hypothetical protein [Verrucomicrobiota bacterium]